MSVSSKGLAACLALGLVCGQVTKHGQVDQDPLLSEMIFTENLLYERKGTSRIGCASLCLKTDQCVKFTFTPVTSADDVCRGHSGRINSSTEHEVSVGTELYAIRKEPKEDWLETYCVDDNGCSEPNSVCFKDTGCTCKPGFYYSVSGKTCVGSCDNLHDTYIRYKLSVMMGHAEGSAGGGLTDCKSACTNHPSLVCQNFDYNSTTGACFLCNHTADYQNYVDWNEDFSGWDNYQRTCY